MPVASSLETIEGLFPEEEDCIRYIEAIRWDHKPVSPFSPGSRVYKCARNNYKCKDTGKYFNVKTSTLFGDTKISLKKWFMAIHFYSLEKGRVSSRKLATGIGVTQKTAWFMIQRIKSAYQHAQVKDLSNSL